MPDEKFTIPEKLDRVEAKLDCIEILLDKMMTKLETEIRYWKWITGKSEPDVE